MKPIRRNDAICILHMSLKLIGYPLTIQEIIEKLKYTDNLPSHINISNMVTESSLVFWEKGNHQEFNEKYRQEENFLYHHLIHPVSEALNRLAIDHFSIVSCVVNQVRHFSRILILPTSVSTAILPIAQWLIKRLLCETDEKFTKVIFPNIELWAISAIYLSLVSIQTEDQEFVDFLTNWTFFFDKWNAKTEMKMKIRKWTENVQTRRDIEKRKIIQRKVLARCMRMRAEIVKFVPAIESQFEEEKNNFIAKSRNLQFEKQSSIRLPVNNEEAINYEEYLPIFINLKESRKFQARQVTQYSASTWDFFVRWSGYRDSSTKNSQRSYRPDLL